MYIIYTYSYFHTCGYSGRFAKVDTVVAVPNFYVMKLNRAARLKKNVLSYTKIATYSSFSFPFYKFSYEL